MHDTRAALTAAVLCPGTWSTWTRVPDMMVWSQLTCDVIGMPSNSPNIPTSIPPVVGTPFPPSPDMDDNDGQPPARWPHTHDYADVREHGGSHALTSQIYQRTKALWDHWLVRTLRSTMQYELQLQ